jgi:hypothetical protein
MTLANEHVRQSATRNVKEGISMSMTVTISLTRPQLLALYKLFTFELDWGEIDVTEEGAMQAVVDAMNAASPDEDLDEVTERVGPRTPWPRSGRGQQRPPAPGQHAPTPTRHETSWN